MPATSREDLLEVTRKEFSKLEKLVAGIEENAALYKDNTDTSIKDVVAHRAHWIGLFLGWYRDGLDGKEVFFPSKGYKWNDLKRYNADLRERQEALGWTEAQSTLVDAHHTLVAFMEECSETDLYGGPMAGANNNWTPGRWAEAAGPSHYRSAAKAVRSRVKRLRTADSSTAEIVITDVPQSAP